MFKQENNSYKKMPWRLNWIFEMGKRFCPKCESTNVGMRLNILLAVGVPQEWKCNECGYSGFIFPELEEVKEK